MTRPQFAYYKEKSPSEIIRHIKDIVADACEGTADTSFLFLSSDYSAAFDTVSRDYIFNVLRLINFPEKIIDMIKKLIC